uniref:G-protein coupled receptors family 1 profile domain-containing protein n=1 Tax=Onchocerca volvulus TaxID=6282 RepID=A0A8R1XM32_ONCVO
MDFDINETTTEDANTVVNNGSLPLKVVSHILHTYAYLFIGALLILVNIPVFLLVIMHKTLRNFYAILVVASLNSELTGVSTILLGVKRIIVSVGGERLIDHHGCVLNIPILLLTSYFLNGLCLLMNSMERLCVVAFPIYYYTHSKQIICSLIAAQYVIAIIVITSTATAIFVVLPSIAEHINLMGTSVISQIIVVICFYLRLLNSCNMVIVFLYLQKDLRYAAIQSFKNRFRGTKDHVQSIKITGFGK